MYNLDIYNYSNIHLNYANNTRNVDGNFCWVSPAVELLYCMLKFLMDFIEIQFLSSSAFVHP